MSNTPTVVSVLNLKGGVGKTTITALLARHAEKAGLDVLAVDLDPQANLSQALMTTRDYIQFMEEKQPSIVELFNGFRPASRGTPGPTALNPTDVIQQISFGSRREGHGWLEVIPSRFDFSDNLIHSIHPTDSTPNEKVLATFIAKHMQHKDLILIDCAPTESILTRTSYHASRYVLIPVKTELFSTIGFPLMKQSLEDFRARNRGHAIGVCGVVIHRTKTSGQGPSKDGRESLRDIEEKAQQYNWHVFENIMHHSDAYPRWASDPHAGHLGNAAIEWPKIANEILSNLGFTHVSIDEFDSRSVATEAKRIATESVDAALRKKGIKKRDYANYKNKVAEMMAHPRVKEIAKELVDSRSRKIDFSSL